MCNLTNSLKNLNWTTKTRRQFLEPHKFDHSSNQLLLSKYLLADVKFYQNLDWHKTWISLMHLTYIAQHPTPYAFLQLFDSNSQFQSQELLEISEFDNSPHTKHEMDLIIGCKQIVSNTTTNPKIIVFFPMYIPSMFHDSYWFS